MSLGATLKAARARRGLSLRGAEAASGISNGYLSQLESDSVRTPSPRHLHMLSEVYAVPYAELLTAAGYALPTSDAADASTPDHATGLLFAAGYLRPDDENKVRGYADALREAYNASLADARRSADDEESPD